MAELVRSFTKTNKDESQSASKHFKESEDREFSTVKKKIHKDGVDCQSDCDDALTFNATPSQSALEDHDGQSSCVTFENRDDEEQK